MNLLVSYFGYRRYVSDQDHGGSGDGVLLACWKLLKMGHNYNLYIRPSAHEKLLVILCIESTNSVKMGLSVPY